MTATNLIQKYVTTGPRYTSYPTVPQWHPADSTMAIDALTALHNQNHHLSVYVHIPFCKRLCAYCACNVVIRRHESSAEAYLMAIEKEMDLVVRCAGKHTVLQLHLGGGTPNFLTVTQMSQLFTALENHFDILPNAEISVECDPRHLTSDQLNGWSHVGVNRLSMGIQDFDPTVQQAIRRIQPFEQVSQWVSYARKIGMDAINMDLIYGLPHQTPSSIHYTMDCIEQLQPNRIAFYSYAHLPQLQKHQRVIPDHVLPRSAEKLDLFSIGCHRLTSAGYVRIGMDHFCKQTDPLLTAQQTGNLHRNFMGYTNKITPNTLGLGVSAISDINQTYFQNEKDINTYMRCLNQAKLPVAKGMVLNPDDMVRKWVIGQLMCHFCVDKHIFFQQFGQTFDHYFKKELSACADMVSDGLMDHSHTHVWMMPDQRPWVRNVCMIFDRYLNPSKQPTTSQFSQTL